MDMDLGWKLDLLALKQKLLVRANYPLSPSRPLWPPDFRLFRPYYSNTKKALSSQ